MSCYICREKYRTQSKLGWKTACFCFDKKKLQIEQGLIKSKTLYI